MNSNPPSSDMTLCPKCEQGLLWTQMGQQACGWCHHITWTTPLAVRFSELAVGERFYAVGRDGLQMTKTEDRDDPYLVHTNFEIYGGHTAGRADEGAYCIRSADLEKLTG